MAAQRTRKQGTAPVIPFLNLDPVVCLVGWSNEALVIIDEQKVTALIDSGTQVSSISSGFCKLLILEVHSLGRLLELEGTGGSAIPYLGYVEVNLQIQGTKGYNEESCCWSYQPQATPKRVPVMVGSKIIDQVMGMMTKGDLVRATVTWKQAQFVVVMSRHSSFPTQIQKWQEKRERRSTVPQALILQHPGVLSGRCSGTSPCHSQGYHPSIWDC